MTWLVFGVSCLLVLAGAVSIISGAPIIQLERGWAEVISGTVALSSGGVVFALAGILMRLESIRDTMAARIVPVAAETVPAPQPAPHDTRSEALSPATPADPLPAPVARTETRPAAEAVPVEEPSGDAPDDEAAATQGLWKRVKRPGSERPAVETLRQQGFPDRIAPEEPETASRSEIAVVVPAHAVAVVPTVVPVPPRPVETALRDAAPGGAEAGQIGWLERSLFKTRTVPGDGEAARPEPSFGARPTAPVEPRVETMPTVPEPTVTHEPSFHAPEPGDAAEPQPTPDLASELHKDATVVGRYQAGSASYVMYSDGTIEVETESGEMHRFGSMDELKAFIAQQDTTVS